MYKDLNPRKIIYSGDCTIVFWQDGTKTIVRRSKGTKDDKHSAFCAALAKKVFNTNSELKRKIKVAENTKRIKHEKKKFSLSKAVTDSVTSGQLLNNALVRSNIVKKSFASLKQCLELEDSPRYRVELDSVESVAGCPTEHHFTLYQYY